VADANPDDDVMRRQEHVALGASRIYAWRIMMALRPVELHILVSLADADRHGYAIRAETARRTGGDVLLEPGTLYRALRRLLDAALVAPVPLRDGEDERRRRYRLTPAGRRAARAEVDRLLATAQRASRALEKARP
jgi:DNA-binding PadR family transcriptional regulator